MYNQVLLTREVVDFIRTRDWPKKLQYDLSEADGPIHLYFYRDNFVTLTGEEQWQVAMMVKETMETLRKRGIPIELAKMESRRG